MGRDWALMALLATLVAVPIVIGGVAAGQLNDFVGGLPWQALGEAEWEAFVVVGVCLGSLVLFR
jgi:hypothetical protein